MSNDDRPIYRLDQLDFIEVPHSFFTMSTPWYKDDLVYLEEVNGHVEIVNVSFQARQKTEEFFGNLHK